MSLTGYTLAPPVGAAPRLDAESLYRAHVQTVARWVARLGGPTVSVEDAVQEVFLVVHRRIGDFRPGGAKISTWLFRITERVVRFRKRKESLRRALFGPRSAPVPDVPSPRPTPVDEIERNENIALFYRILDGMSDKYRTPLILFEMEEMPAEDIAVLIGVKPATVWVRLHRARRQLLDQVAKSCQRRRA